MTSLAVRSLTIAREGQAILESVSFSAQAGEFIAVVGPNGAGKTTLLRALAGVERPQSGAVLVDGVEPSLLPPRRRARALAYLPQARQIHWSMTAETVASLGRFAYGAPHRLGAHDRAAVARALAAADAHRFRERTMTTLSGGEQARIHVARALAAETPFLIADEPTAALDLRHALGIMALLRAKAAEGGLAVAALHDLALARRFSTRVLVLDRGRLAADGPPAAALAGPIIETVFGVAPADIPA
jgi:iron complex transport system ATP-binding protein